MIRKHPFLPSEVKQSYIPTQSTRGPFQGHTPAAPAAGAQLEKASSGFVTTAAVAAAAGEADMPTKQGRKRGPKLPKVNLLGKLQGFVSRISVHEGSTTKILAYWSN